MLFIDVGQPRIRRVFDFPRGAAPFFEKARGLPLTGGRFPRWVGSRNLKGDDVGFDMEAHHVVPGWETEGAESGSFGNGGRLG